MHKAPSNELIRLLENRDGSPEIELTVSIKDDKDTSFLARDVVSVSVIMDSSGDLKELFIRLKQGTEFYWSKKAEDTPAKVIRIMSIRMQNQ